MKKVLSILLVFLVMICIGCGSKSTARSTVIDYLDKYNMVDDKVMEELDDYIKEEDLTKEQKEKYKKILKKQYESMVYEIKNETYEDEKAYVNVGITVFDLYEVQQLALSYLNNHPEEFLDDEGNYDKNKFMDYKLDQMEQVEKRVSYDLVMILEKDNGMYKLEPLTNEDLQKIHGIYNYEE